MLLVFEWKNIRITVSAASRSEPMFLAKEVAIALGLDVPNISKFLKGNLRPKDFRQISGESKGRPPYYVTQSGLFDLILIAKTEDAYDFRYWILDEVLPAVLSNGGYILPTATPVQAIAISDKLAQIISPTKRPWTLHFSASWQKEACRITNVTWKHPRMGQFINQTVYEFFDKEAVAKLRELNVNGQQDHVAHHQYLTEKFDAVAYQQHLRDIEGYMMASPDLDFFWRLMSFRFKKTFQMSLFD